MKYDICIIGCGMSGTMVGVEMLRKGKSVCILSAGKTLNPTSRSEFGKRGGDILDNCRAVSSVIEEGKVIEVMTDNHIRIEASEFILATGRFVSRGLVSDMNGIYEPVFGLDVKYDADPSEWSAGDFFAPQPFESYGVRTEGACALKGGTPVENLYVCGEILCGNVEVKKSVEQVCRKIR